MESSIDMKGPIRPSVYAELPCGHTQELALDRIDEPARCGSCGKTGMLGEEQITAIGRTVKEALAAISLREETADRLPRAHASARWLH